MRKRTIISIIIVTILALFLVQIVAKEIINPEISKYLYTTAVCDKNNYCEDYEIDCDGNTPSRISPTGFSIQQDGEWTDPRGQTKFCE